MIQTIRHFFRVAQSRKREAEKERSRSPKWQEVREEHLKAESACRACGTTKELQVHHIKPFSMHPELELDPLNLITLCMDKYECHLLIGHGGSFDFCNENVVRDVEEVRSCPKQRPLIEERARQGRVRETDKSR